MKRNEKRFKNALPALHSNAAAMRHKTALLAA